VNTNSRPSFGGPNIVQAQAVLFNNAVEDLERAVIALARAAELAIAAGVISKLVLIYGDGSPFPVLDENGLTRLREAARGVIRIECDVFHADLGPARGHNRLAAQAEPDTDFIWIQNPNVVVAPRVFELVLEPFGEADVGQVEARQIPIEHPKDYDPSSGETEWTTGACVMTPVSLFRELGGYDADCFPLCCEDVDLSFRIREMGLRLIFQPAAACFHDRRPSPEGGWRPAGVDDCYSAEADLLMAHKWSRPDLVERWLRHFVGSGDQHLEKSAQAYLQRAAVGALPEPRDPRHLIAALNGQFSYAAHRFSL
jgi:hypothetical protein